MSSLAAFFIMISLATSNITSSPGSRTSLDGKVSAKSYEPVPQPAALVLMRPPLDELPS